MPEAEVKDADLRSVAERKDEPAKLFDLIQKSNFFTQITRIMDGYQQSAFIEMFLNSTFEKCFWFLRECARFHSKEYKRPYLIDLDQNAKVQAFLNDNPGFFVHVSKVDPLYLAFTPPEEKYQIGDRQMRISPGKFFKRHAVNWTDETIKAVATAWRASYDTSDIKFAVGPEELERVYVTGPHSCMAYSGSTGMGIIGRERHYWSSHIHPSAAYDTPDLKLAYLEDEDKHITARCLIRTDKKIFIRNYGDEALLFKLQQLGYELGNMNGVRLKLIPAVDNNGATLPNTYVCPYIDDQSAAAYKAVYVVVHTTDSGEKWLRVYNGSSNDQLPGDNYNNACGAYGAQAQSGLVGDHCNHRRADLLELERIARATAVRCTACGENHDSSETKRSLYEVDSRICPACALRYYRAAWWSTAASTRTLVRADECIQSATDSHVFFRDEPRILAHYRYVRLDRHLYPAHYGKVVSKDTTVTTSTGRTILAEDSVASITGEREHKDRCLWLLIPSWVESFDHIAYFTADQPVELTELGVQSGLLVYRPPGPARQSVSMEEHSLLSLEQWASAFDPHTAEAAFLEILEHHEQGYQLRRKFQSAFRSLIAQRNSAA